MIDCTFELAACFNLRPAALGREIWRHEFREDNTRADELTHEARHGRTFYRTHCYLYPFETYLVPFAIRGGFDGGVDQQGSGCGFWLQIGLINTQCNPSEIGIASARTVGPFPAGHEFAVSSAVPLVWRDVAEAAWLLEGATVTECELSAAEALLSAARVLLRDRSSPSCTQLGTRVQTKQKPG